MAARPRSERIVRAGPVTATLENGGLRWLRLGDAEFVRGVYVAVRDEAWRTIAGELEDLKVTARASSFEVTFLSRHREGEIDFSWSGQISGDVRGSIRFSMDGTAHSTFERNRIGFCVLHPMSQAGIPLTVVTPTDTRDAAFPVEVSPGDPFTDIIALRFPVSPAANVSIQLEGDLFEMEDQRNWTDGSFKTFCTPHRLPHPVTIEQGSRVRQSVSITVSGTAQSAARPPGPPRALRDPAADAVVIHGDRVHQLPRIGTTLAPGREHLDRSAIDALRKLQPAGLRTTLELDDDGWKAALTAASELTRAIDARLEIEVWAGDDGDGLHELVGALTGMGISEADVYIFPTTSHATTVALVERLRETLPASGARYRVGGGSRANFAELNRADVPIELLDVVGFAISPQVHAFDDASLFETVAAQAIVVRDARRLAGSRQLAVGPITLLPRFNPYTGSRPRFGVDTEEARRDHRQQTWFAGAWTLASLAAITGAGATSVSYHEVVGPAGLMERDGTLNPVGSVLIDVLALGPANVIRSTGPADLAVLALSHDSNRGSRILVANLREDRRSVDLRLAGVPEGPARWRVAGEPTGGARGSAGPYRVELGPYEVMRLDTGFDPPGPSDRSGRMETSWTCPVPTLRIR